ncbi:MAG: phosphomannose isomerase type II C-terminal cupin domain [Parachlamydiales bacterium]|jgi:mannose-6-phosphate isomerase-like protein (cupin superfamily)
MAQNTENILYKKPWGSFQSLKIKENCQVKWIEVKANSKISLQKHLKRSEHWIVIKGSPVITVNDLRKKYNENEHIFIPKEAIHRIENESDQTIIILEVQNGSYLGEDDIIRLDDIYGRV